MGLYLKVVRDNYANFNGRARRKEYWMFVLFNIIFCFVAMILDNMLGLSFEIYGENIGYGWIYMLYCLAVFIPGCAVLIRRLHDVGKSGWFMLICLIPLIGTIWILVLMCTDGDKTENTYGPSPKE